MTWAEWEADAAERRAAVVKKIKDNSWGLSADGKTLTGPEGFTIDISKCPAGWSNTEGLTDTTIKIGHTFPYSGTLAEYGNIGRGDGELLQLRQRHLRGHQGLDRQDPQDASSSRRTTATTRPGRSRSSTS